MKSFRPIKTAAVAASGLVLVASMAACSRPAADQAQAATDQTTLRVGVGIDAAYAPFFVADAEGMFTKAGLKVELVQFGRGGEAVDAVNAGEINLAGNSDTTTAAQMASSDKLRAIASYESSGQYIKAVLRDGLSGPKDVKKLGYVQGLSQIATNKYLEANGIDPKSVELVTAAPADMPALLRRGDIDGYVMWEPWPQTAVDQKIGHVDANSAAFGFSYHHWLVTNEAWLSGHEETAQKFTKVLDEAAKKTEADPDLAATVTEKAVKIKPADTKVAIDQIDFAVESLGTESVKSTTEIVDFYQSIGAIKSRPDLSKALVLDWYKGV
ncbi:ABC transporter substrate-binding protein [Raineyella sp. W15-4]|uniref:ABC transporter substrate-binding protein n=1 Tax=Raineyella sp. W15-4 TaxID=3081651 RepID=UPI002952DB00|nr:ABC transporter substrate-binding protein [Raineyella sp. W15-4]WOQ17388.1 ABC transporter substrate-binding protein [Raineyella sp. W15-4]